MVFVTRVFFKLLKSAPTPLAKTCSRVAFNMPPDNECNCREPHGCYETNKGCVPSRIKIETAKPESSKHEQRDNDCVKCGFHFFTPKSNSQRPRKIRRRPREISQYLLLLESTTLKGTCRSFLRCLPDSLFAFVLSFVELLFQHVRCCQHPGAECFFVRCGEFVL